MTFEYIMRRLNNIDCTSNKKIIKIEILLSYLSFLYYLSLGQLFPVS